MKIKAVQSKEKVRDMSLEEIQELRAAITENSENFPKAVIRACNQRLLQAGLEGLSKSILKVKNQQMSSKNSGNKEFKVLSQDGKDVTNNYLDDLSGKEVNHKQETQNKERRIAFALKYNPETIKVETTAVLKKDAEENNFEDLQIFTDNNGVDYYLLKRIAERKAEKLNETLSKGGISFEKCVGCGRYFMVGTKDTNFYKEKGWNKPSHCIDCRKDKKAKAAEREKEKQQIMIYTLTYDKAANKVSVIHALRTEAIHSHPSEKGYFYGSQSKYGGEIPIYKNGNDAEDAAKFINGLLDSGECFIETCSKCGMLFYVYKGYMNKSKEESLCWNCKRNHNS